MQLNIFKYAYALEGLCMSLALGYFSVLAALISGSIYAGFAAWRLR